MRANCGIEVEKIIDDLYFQQIDGIKNVSKYR